MDNVHNTVVVDGDCELLMPMSGECNLKILADGEVGVVMEVPVVNVPPYEGEYTITPTQERQIIEAGGKWIIQDIIINPIPQNYGLIEWNGATLKVS